MRRIVVIGIVVLAAVVGNLAYQRYLQQQPFEWSGTVDARTMDVGSRVGGRIAQVHVREGDNVQPNAPLITLEPGDLLAQRLQAQGQLTQAQAALDRIADSHLPTARRAEIAAARARLQADEIALEKAKIDDERITRLMAGGAATIADRDNSSIALRNAQVQVSALSATLDELLAGTPQDVKSAHGSVDVAAGKLQQISIMLDELIIRAPRAARVEVLDLRPGDIVGANATAARLLEPTELYVRIYVPETQIGHIHAGLSVPIFVDSFPAQPFDGTVEFVSDEGEYSPRNLQTADERADQVFAARIRLNNPNNTLRAGMAAFARVPHPAKI